MDWLAPKFIVIYLFVAAVLYVHFRGRVRHKLIKQFTDHSTVLAPYNALCYLFSAVPGKPILDVNEFKAVKPLRENWQVIRDEALHLFNEGYIRAALKNNDAGFNSFFKKGWKRFYLKWYGAALPSAHALCPKTVAILDAIPEVNGAMFALLPPGGTLNPHRDPFAGSLRYHLGLVTPNSDECRIFVDGQPYAWRDGQDVVFDETYIHSAENKTDVTRIILFCDVERPLHTAVMRWINHWVKRIVVRASSTQNVEGEEVGLINRLFGLAYYAGEWRRRFKRANKPLYQVSKVALFVAILALILWI